MARILVAEDEEPVREFVARALENQGHEVVAVGDGGAAIETAERVRIDLLVADIVMPVMDGIALALKLRESAPDLPILLMTGYAAEKQRAHNLDMLITDVLSKPFNLDQLRGAVRQALESRGDGDDAPG